MTKQSRDGSVALAECWGLFRAHRRTNKSAITRYVTVTMLLLGMMAISIAFLLGAVYFGRP
jgi:hypothetical protein